VTYRRRPSPLHAARAASGTAYCAALVALSLLTDHPLLLAAALGAVVGAGLAAGVGAELARAARIAVPLALLIAVINPLFTREGLTVIARLGEVPWLGRLDITLEACAYGALLGVRVLVILMCFALYSAAVDPDEVLRLLRRLSFRSALTATLTTRMGPVLARDARRMADAQRCRPGPRAPRGAVVRAVATGALDRAVDVAATLELRGYAGARRPPRERSPWSRHDIAFAAAAVAIAALAGVARATGAAVVEAYPRLHVALGPGEVGIAVAVVAVALLPFADRRGVLR
jgi:energy-coupling factor transport system permease protein